MSWFQKKKPEMDADAESRIIAAIAEAEKDNRGEVRVHIEANCPVEDALVPIPIRRPSR